MAHCHEGHHLLQKMGISNFIVEPMNLGFCCIKRLKKNKKKIQFDNGKWKVKCGRQPGGRGRLLLCSGPRIPWTHLFQQILATCHQTQIRITSSTSSPPEKIFPPRSFHPFPRNFDPPQCSSRISYGGGWHFTHWNRIGPVFARKLAALWVKDFDGRFCVPSGLLNCRIWLFQSKCLFCTPICRGPENHSHIYCRISSQNLLCQEMCLLGHNLPL
jgi:hypothetical protein